MFTPRLIIQLAVGVLLVALVVAGRVGVEGVIAYLVGLAVPSPLPIPTVASKGDAVL